MASELNPQQLDFLARYMKPDSETYGNAYQSAMAAGYSENYASNILEQAPWLVDKRGTGVITKEEIIEGIKAETKGDRATDRLKAYELLGKSQKLFTDKVEHSGEATLNVNIVKYEDVA